MTGIGGTLEVPQSQPDRLAHHSVGVEEGDLGRLHNLLIDLEGEVRPRFQGDAGLVPSIWFSNSTSTPLTRALAAYRKLDLRGSRPPRALRVLPRRAVHLNAAQVARLVERYRAGATTYQLASEFGCERRTVALRLKQAGVVLPHGRKARPPQPLFDQAADLRASGLSLRAIGERMGYSRSVVERYLRLANGSVN